MTARDDEEEERRRQEAERKKMRPVDRVYDTPPKTSITGELWGHYLRRTGRVVPALFRMTLKTKAIMTAIKQRDQIPSDPVFLEILLQTYLDKYRDPPITLPSDEELYEKFLRERDRRDDE
jgi:hypothetical protein